MWMASIGAADAPSRQKRLMLPNAAKQRQARKMAIAQVIQRDKVMKESGGCQEPSLTLCCDNPGLVREAVLSRKHLNYCRELKALYPAATAQELRQALHKRFLADVDYFGAAAGATTPGGAGGGDLLGWLLGLLLWPLVALIVALPFMAWHAVFPKNKQRIAAEIEEAIRIVQSQQPCQQ
jgi:hypothetical protein